ncbi:MAG: spinster family MFS transporter, partial [Gemmataceae bacterium]
MAAPSVSDSPSPARTLPGANAALALLMIINLFNYIDRQVLSAVLPRLQRDASILRLDDPNAQLKMGALSSAFMASYMV